MELYKTIDDTTILLSTDYELVKKAVENKEPAIFLITNENRFSESGLARYAFEIEEFTKDDYDNSGKYTGSPACLKSEEILNMLTDKEARRLIAKCKGEPVIIADNGHLELREMSEADIDYIVELYLSEGASFLERFFNEEEEAREILKHYMDNVYDFYGYGLWSLYEKNKDNKSRFVGLTGFTDRAENDENMPDNLELGFAIMPKDRGRGLATEGAELAINYAKENIVFHKILINTDPSNKAAVAVATAMIRKAGFLQNTDGCYQYISP